MRCAAEKLLIIRIKLAFFHICHLAELFRRPLFLIVAQHRKAQLLKFLVQSGRLLRRLLIQPHAARCRDHHLTDQRFLVFHRIRVLHNVFPLLKTDQFIDGFCILRIKNCVLRNAVLFPQIFAAPEMNIAVAEFLHRLVMLLVIQRVKKAGIFLGNDKRSSVIHLHRRFKQQKQIVPASLRPVYCLTVRVGPIIFTDMN